MGAPMYGPFMDAMQAGFSVNTQGELPHKRLNFFSKGLQSFPFFMELLPAVGILQSKP